MGRRKAQGFTLIELLIVIAIIGVLGAVLVPNLLSARERAQHTAAKSYLYRLGSEIAVCSVDSNFPADVGANTRPAGCTDITWPVGADVPFGSTFDYENWDLGNGERWVGITFYGKSNSRTSIPNNTNLGPGLQEHGSGDNLAYSFALIAP